ncbi:hypothetical protein SUGI_0654610 [Cryptomeria japonica]|nr:hypothetical protein SUGI_0654610 [Cryptomeria japonica]
MSNTIFSKNLFDPNNPESAELRNSYGELTKLAGKTNLADFYPFLRFLEHRGVSRDLTVHQKRLHKLLRCIPKEKDFLDILLDSTADDFTLENIRALIMELLSGGSDTTAATIEWAIVELIANPHVMKQAQKELEEIIGFNRRVQDVGSGNNLRGGELE